MKDVLGTVAVLGLLAAGTGVVLLLTGLGLIALEYLSPVWDVLYDWYQTLRPAVKVIVWGWVLIAIGLIIASLIFRLDIWQEGGA